MIHGLLACWPLYVGLTSKLPRVLVYDAYPIKRDERPIVMVVRYGTGVDMAASAIRGGGIRHGIRNMLLGNRTVKRFIE